MPDAADATPDLLFERPAEGVLLLRLNRPERRNALSTPLLQAVAAALAAAEGDETVRAVIVTGNDTVFAAGADINELAASGADDPVETPRFLAWAAIRGFTKPLLAAVEGWCLGAGCELMLCADIVVAGATAKIGLPETNLGIMPGAGGTATLPRLVGRALAMRMVLTGEPIGVEDARQAGLVAEVAASGEAERQALALAEKLAARAPLALAAAKRSIRRALDLPHADHLRFERETFIALLGSADKDEGIAAFREKRAPVWRGA